MRKTQTTPTSDVELIDVKELVTSIEKASTICAAGGGAFCDLRSLFEAIAAASRDGSLACRLAVLGKSLCESQEIEFDRYLMTYDLDAERFAASLAIAREVNHG